MHFYKLSDLLDSIDLLNNYIIIVKGEEDKNPKVRTNLSNIIQQMVYLNLPLERIQVVSEKEIKDLKKINSYLKNINLYENISQDVHSKISKIEFMQDSDLKKKVLESLKDINKLIKESKTTDLIISVVASKKSGKSVVVNSILESELAPTSLELATPNNCIYKKSNCYYLTFKEETKYFNSPSELKKYLLPLFKDASLNKESKYSLPDMEIGYIPKSDRFCSYTIYDTPGPDLVGVQDSQALVAKDAIDKSDVAIFPIDYTKYLTDNEYNWLTEVKDVFAKKQRFYSFVLDVNKLDMRFQSEEDKSIVRILDFIREKLISIDSRFKDSIIFGSSALTYFNCLEVVNIPGFEDLSTSQDFKKDLDEKENELNDDQYMNIVNDLTTQTKNIKNFLKQKVKTLNELKEYSKMPQLLSYLEYVTKNKARAERINNILYKIDTEFAKISNLLRFSELENDLALNKEKLESAIKIIDTFSTNVDCIFDERYLEVIEKAKSNNQELESSSLKNGFSQLNPNMKYITGYVRESIIDKELSEAKCITEVIESLKNLFRNEYKKTLENSNIKRYGENVLHEDDICKIFCNLYETKFESLLISQINQQIDTCTNKLIIETNNIQKDLSKVVNERQKKLEISITKLKNDLKTDCDIDDFDLDKPSFDFSFKYQGEATPKTIDTKKIRNSEIFRALRKSFTTSTLSSFDKIANFVSCIFKQEINEITNKWEAVSKVYDEQISNIIKESINDILKDTIISSKDTITKMVENVVTEIVEQMDFVRNFGKEQAESARRTIDNTKVLSNNIECLENKINKIKEIKEYLYEFNNLWKINTK